MWLICVVPDLALPPSFSFTNQSPELPINGFRCCLHICIVKSLCCCERIRKGTTMNNLHPAVICKRVNRHKKQHASNSSSLHRINCLVESCVLPHWSSLSFMTDSGSAGFGDFCSSITVNAWLMWESQLNATVCSGFNLIQFEGLCLHGSYRNTVAKGLNNTRYELTQH